MMARTPERNGHGDLTGLRLARISTVPFYVVAQLKGQITFLGKQGAKVYVIASDEPELREFDNPPSVNCYAIEIPRLIAPWQDCRALLRLWAFFRRHRTQIAHSTTPKAGLLTAVAALFAGVPVRLHTFTGQPWVTMSGVKRWLARGSDKLIGVLNTRCYTDSPSQRQFLIDQGIIETKKLFVVGQGSLGGVDVTRFDPNRYSHSQRRLLRQSLGISGDAPILLFVGRITTDKGVRELLQAFQRISFRVRDIHLVFVGHFDEQSGVANSLSRSDVEAVPQTHIVAYTPEPEAYMAIADVLCLPSYREGFGTVVIEAAAMGVPTVGTEIYGLTDAVVNGETGILVPPRDAESLAQALIRLVTDSDLRARMGRAARARVLEHFDANRINLKILNEYRALIAQAGITNFNA